MSRMRGKQKLVRGFDLDAFVDGADEPSDMTPKTPKPVRNAPSSSATAADKVSERVQIMLTKKELDIIKDKTGLVPISKWLRNELKEKGVI